MRGEEPRTPAGLPAGVPAFGDGPGGPSFPDTGRPHLDPSTRQDSRHLCRAFQADGPDAAWANRSAGRLAGYAEWAEPGVGGPLHAPASAGAAVRDLSAPGTRRLVPAERRLTPVDHSCRKEAHLPAGGVFDFPAEHWIPLRTTNPIESTFSTVRRRARGTAALAMVFKLVESAQQRWRAGGQRASPRPPAQLHVPGHIARQFVLSNDVPGWGCVLVRPGDSRSIRWCPIGHFGLMVVTVFRWVAHLSGERWATPAVRRCVVRVGMPSLCPGVQAVIRFASSGAVRRGPRWEFLGGPLS